MAPLIHFNPYHCLKAPICIHSFYLPYGPSIHSNSDICLKAQKMYPFLLFAIWPLDTFQFLNLPLGPIKVIHSFYSPYGPSIHSNSYICHKAPKCIHSFPSPYGPTIHSNSYICLRPKCIHYLYSPYGPLIHSNFYICLKAHKMYPSLLFAIWPLDTFQFLYICLKAPKYIHSCHLPYGPSITSNSHTCHKSTKIFPYICHEIHEPQIIRQRDLIPK